MHSGPIEHRAAIRARWLAELFGALGAAQQLLFDLDLHEARAAEAGDLHQRIDAARLEIRSLQLGHRFNRSAEVPPEWTGFPPWQD